jgi:hypothetical protein
MPGLWDMHVHSLKISPQYTHPLSIAAGVTGVREMWGCPSLPDSFVACGEDIERWRRGLLDGSHLAPRYIQRSRFAINDERSVPSAAPGYFKAQTIDDARALVAYHANAGVDLLKVYDDLSPTVYEALAAEAAMHGLFLAGHLPVRVITRAGDRQRATQHRTPPAVGLAIHDELSELVRAGLSPADALRTATIDAARFTGKDHDYGSIEVGKVADMILLDADPLAHIGSTQRMAGVFFNGQYLDHADLDQLLAFAEDQADSVLVNIQLLWAALQSPVVRAEYKRINGPSALVDESRSVRG